MSIESNFVHKSSTQESLRGQTCSRKSSWILKLTFWDDPSWHSCVPMEKSANMNKLNVIEIQISWANLTPTQNFPSQQPQTLVANNKVSLLSTVGCWRWRDESWTIFLGIVAVCILPERVVCGFHPVSTSHVFGIKQSVWNKGRERFICSFISCGCIGISIFSISTSTTWIFTCWFMLSHLQVTIC